MKPRLLFIIPGTDTGGMEHFLLRLLPRFEAHAEVAVVVRSRRQGTLHERYLATGCALHYQPVGYVDPIGKWHLYRILKKFQANTVCDLSGIFSGVTLMVARCAGVGHRVTFHRRSTYAFELTWARRIYARLSIFLVETMATGILANSRTALNYFHPRLVKQKDSRLAVVRNMIDPNDLRPVRSREDVRRELDIPESARVVLHVGRLDPAKDHQTLLASMQLVMKKCSDAYCILAGPRTERLKTHPVIVNQGSESRFRILGDRNDIPDLMEAADLFFFPSVTEGMPNALVEAMLSGLPVIASNIEPIRELVPECDEEYLVQPCDVLGFSEAILDCFLDKGQGQARVFQAMVSRMTAPALVWPKLYRSLFPWAAQPKNGASERNTSGTAL